MRFGKKKDGWSIGEEGLWGSRNSLAFTRAHERYQCELEAASRVQNDTGPAFVKTSGLESFASPSRLLQRTAAIGVRRWSCSPSSHLSLAILLQTPCYSPSIIRYISLFCSSRLTPRTKVDDPPLVFVMEVTLRKSPCTSQTFPLNLWFVCWRGFSMRYLLTG